MKIVLVSLNARYAHTPLAVWYLKSILDMDPLADCVLLDKTINEETDLILSEIIRLKPDVVCFSVYIWNIETVRKLAGAIKCIDMKIRVVLGGPEVSYGLDREDMLMSAADHIIKGEGEFALKDYIFHGKKSDGFNIVNELDHLESPYKHEFISGIKNRIIYFESSRGCPFGCSYCLSSTTEGVRYFPLQRVKDELKKILSYDNVKIIKFVDRTFNSDAERAKKILRYILKIGPDCRFHFEIVAEFLDEETIDILNRSPKGMFMLEIGLQSTNEKTLLEIGRRFPVQKAFENTKKLKEGDKTHIHLDLIFGLPYDDMPSMERAFETAYSLRPHELQIGFLKMLKGSKIRRTAGEHGYEYKWYPPYEIISSRYISFEEVCRLKKVESVFNRVYNTKLYICSLEKLNTHFKEKSFDLYQQMAEYFEGKGYFERSISAKDLSFMLYEFGLFAGTDIREEIIFDHLSTNRGFGLHKIFLPAVNVKSEVVEFFSKSFPSEPVQKVMKRVSFYPFNTGTVVFLHDEKDPVSGYFKSIRI